MVIIDVCDFLELLLVLLEAFDLTKEDLLELLSFAAELLLASHIVTISARTRCCLCHIFIFFV